MAIIIGVRFREAGRVYYFNPGKLEIKKGDRVVVETSRGVECGEVAQEPTDIPEEQLKHPLKEVMRLATAQDIQTVEGKAEKEAEAFRVCEEKILKHGLDMKLVNVEANFEGSKIIFHFTADQRVDFRALVRDLAGVFRTRIELRQIGVRDEAKLLGGLGICGRPFCCSQFMGDFHPVSIKMAKEQGLSLNPAKISGTCGRLMCCLKYEEAAYEDALKHLPRAGSYIDTPEGRGMVTELNAISGNIKVRLESRPDAPPMLFHYDPEKGARKPAPSNRLMPQLGEMLAAHDPEPRPELRSQPEARSRPERPAAAEKPERPYQQKNRQKQQQKPQQQKRKRPQAHGPAAAPQKPQQQLAKKQPEPPAASKSDESKKHQDGKNWRDRHAGHHPKQQPAYRQAPPQQQPAAKQKKAEAVKEAPSRAKEAPGYSEIPAPRRAVAQKPEPPRQPGGRRLWPKRGDK